MAQAAATAAAMMPGRSSWSRHGREPQRAHPGDRLAGVGRPVRDARRGDRSHPRAWRGACSSHRGTHYTVQNARIYTLPEPAPPIYLAAAPTVGRQRPARIGDGLIGTGPGQEAAGRCRAVGRQRSPDRPDHRLLGPSSKRAREIARTGGPTSRSAARRARSYPLPRTSSSWPRCDRGRRGRARSRAARTSRSTSEDPGLHRCRLRPGLSAPGRADQEDSSSSRQRSVPGGSRTVAGKHRGRKVSVA